jgi:LuxR family transcriptional regulator, maltose regulon positive regulatory protein
VSAGLHLSDELPPLAEAKLAAPRQRRGMVPRPRLEQALESGADASLTLVAAPAGYGKTTAVRAWAENSGTALAWVTLDANDNEPARLWTYVATAVDRVRNGLGRRALNRLRSAATGVEVAVDEVMNGIAEFGLPFALVLEFGGEHRYVAEYLSHEVLASLDAGRRGFLLRAAVLGSFTAELCDAALGRSDSAAMLAELEESNMFVLSLECREWFRVHALFAEFATAQLGAVEPRVPQAIHRRAAEWLRSRGLVVEAVGHAAAAGDLEVVAELLSEYHLQLIRNGRSGTLLRWARALPDGLLIEHPDATVGAATAALLVGRMTRERRRFLRLADRARAQHPDRFGTYEDCVTAMVRAAGLDDGVGAAVVEGYRAVELAQRSADETSVAAFSALGRALYFAGDLDGARSAASRAIEHPDTARRAPGVAAAHAVLALVAADRGRLGTARDHAETARALVGKITSSRSWLGSTVAEAVGAVLAAEDDLAGAEREFSYAERFLEDDLPTVPHARVLIRLAGVRCRRGRLDDAEDTLRRAREELAELGDSGAVPLFADEVASEIEQARRHAGDGAIVELPSEAELVVLRLLATELSARQIGAQLFLSPNTVKSHIRSIYRKLGVSSREDAVARADTMGLLERNHPGDPSAAA